MKTNPTIETASASLIANYLRELYSITENHARNEYSTLWCDLYHKIMSDIYDIVMKRFDNFDWEPADGYDSYKAECEDFIASFIDFAACETAEEDLFPSFDDYVRHHN